MNLILLPLVLLGVTGSAIYHISEKGISNKRINPLFFIAISAGIVFLIFLFINLFLKLPIVVFSLPLAAISICNAVIDISIIYIYKNKGKLSLVVNIQNSLPSICLAIIGVSFFSETLSLLNILGIASAILGIWLIMGDEPENDEILAHSNSKLKKAFLFLGLLVVSEVVYQISFKLASGTSETLSAMSTIFLFNFIEYLCIILFIKIKEHKKNAITEIVTDFKLATKSYSSYLFAFASFFIVISDYLLYKNGGDVSKVLNYIAPLETVVIALLGLIIYKEKLVRKNIIGIILAILGITLISV